QEENFQENTILTADDAEYTSDFSDYRNTEIEDSEELLRTLKGFMIEWKKLKTSGRMSILEEFGNKLKETGMKHRSGSLVAYAENLLVYIRLFDLSGIEIELGKFPDLIESFKN
ncbi:MAG: hypothetical protein JEY91_19625, partial [Spirochaetaceae bacterium]|nr:hypothetical protein [Spirochaetaceae bacterium]